MRTKPLLIMTVLSITAVLAACGDPEYSGKQTVEDGTEVSYKVEGNTGKMKFESDDHGTTQVAWGEAARISKEFPKDVPVYPGLKVMAASENSELGHFSLQGGSEDAPDKVKAYYREKALAAGWTESGAQAVSQMQALSFRKEGRNMVVNIMPGYDGVGKTIVSVVSTSDKS